MPYPPSELPARTDASSAAPAAHAADHGAEREAINEIVAELGVNPKGSASTVMARLDTIQATVAALPRITVGSSAPVSPVVGDIWFQT